MPWKDTLIDPRKSLSGTCVSCPGVVANHFATVREKIGDFNANMPPSDACLAMMPLSLLASVSWKICLSTTSLTSSIVAWSSSNVLRPLRPLSKISLFEVVLPR